MKKPLLLLLLALSGKCFSLDYLACNSCTNDIEKLLQADNYYESTGNFSFYLVDFQSASIRQMQYSEIEDSSLTTCNTCTTISSYMNAANSLYKSTGQTQVHIANFSNREIISLERYRIIIKKGEGAPKITYGWKQIAAPERYKLSMEISTDGKLRDWEELTPSQEVISEYFSDLSKVEQHLSEIEKITIPSDSGWESAWDVFNNGHEQLMLEQYIFDNFPITSVGSTITSIVGGLVNGALAGVEILVKFSDGSSLLMKAPTAISASAKLEMIPGSARDIDGNSLVNLANISGFQGTFTRENSLNSFLTSIEEMGALIQLVGEFSSRSQVVSGSTGIVTVLDVTSGGSGSIIVMRVERLQR